MLGVLLGCLCPGQVYAGWRLDISFTTSSPRGDLKYDPSHIHALWAEDSTGKFIKTIGRWGVVEHGNLAQWMAADGTHLDGWTGATPKAYQSYRVTWDMTDRSGVEVPDGRYRLRFELTNHNADQGQFHRTSILFDKNGVARTQSFGSRNGYYNISVNYYFEPTVLAEIAAKSATYVTSHTARVYGQITDTGGEDPHVTLYWGEQDRGTDAEVWDQAVALGSYEEGTFASDLTGLDADTTYYYRFLAQNIAGDRWTDTALFSTHGPTGLYSGYRVQSGRVLVTGSKLDIDILSVNDLSRAFALISYGTGWQPDTENANVVLARGGLLEKDKLRIERGTSARSSWVSWQVIECLNEEFKVYRASGSFTSSQTSQDVSLSGPRGRRQGPKNVTVNPALCLAYVTADTKSVSRDTYHQALLTAYVSTPTTLRIQRGSGGADAVNYNWVMVEFDPEKISSVQRGGVSFSTSSNASPRRVKIQPVNPASSLLVYQARTSANGLAYSAIAGRLANSNTVEFYQHQGESGSRNVEFHVIDFGPGATAQRGQIDFSEDIAWVQADVELSRPLDLSSSLYFHGQTCNGTGNYFPRPFSTAEFTSDSSLRIERQCPGQPSYIEWQVLQLPPATFWAQAPGIRLSADVLAFGQVDVGADADLDIRIHNTGNADLQVNSLEIVGLGQEAYSLVSASALPRIVPANAQSDPLTIRFAPSVGQTYDHARLALGSSDPARPVLELALNGTGIRTASSTLQSVALGSHSLDSVGGHSYSVALHGDYVLLGQGAMLTVLNATDPTDLEVVSITNLGSIIQDICVASAVAYVAAESDGLIPVQISDLTAPRALPAVNTQGHAYGVAATDSTLCVATGSGLAIFDLSVPTTPSLKAVYETEGLVRAVTLSGRRAYALDEQWGLQIIDISSPDQPIWLGSYDAIEFGRALDVQGDLVCVVDALGSFFTLDAQDATAPVLLAQTPVSVGAQSLALTPLRAYVAAGPAGLELVDISNPAAPVSLGITPTSDAAADLAVTDAAVYVADKRGGLLIYDSMAPPTTLLGTLESALPDRFKAAYIGGWGRTLYTADGHAGIRIREISYPPEEPAINYVGHFALPSYVYGVATSGSTALVAGGDRAYVLNIANRRSPVLTDTWHSPGQAMSVAIRGGYGYVVNGGMGLQILDLSDPHYVTELGACPMAGMAYVMVTLRYRTAYVASGDAGLHIIDISDPMQPYLVGQFDTPGTVLGMTVGDDLVYLADGENGLVVVDVSVPSAPSLVARSSLPVRAWSTSVVSEKIYVGDDRGGRSILRLE